MNACHSCGSIMTPVHDTGDIITDYWCPDCEGAQRPTEAQRNYNSGAWCACTICENLPKPAKSVLFEPLQFTSGNPAKGNS